MPYASQPDTKGTDYSEINKNWGSWVFVGRRCLVEAAVHGCNSQPLHLGEEDLFSENFLLYCKMAKLRFLEVCGCQHSKGTHTNQAPCTSLGSLLPGTVPVPEVLSPTPHEPSWKGFLPTTVTTHPTDRKPALRTRHSSGRRLGLQSQNVGSCTFSLYTFML